MSRFPRSIGFTLTVYFVLFALLPLIIVVAVALNAVTQSSQQQQIEQRSLALDVRVADFERWLQNAQASLGLTLVDAATNQRLVSLVEADSQLVASSRPITVRTVERFFNQQLAAQGEFSRLFAYSLDGTIAVSSSSTDVGETVSQEPFFPPSLEDAAYISPPFFVASGESPVMYMTVPIHDSQNEIVGILAGEVDMAAFGNIFAAPLGDNQTGEIYLVSHENRLLTPTRAGTDPLGASYSSAGIANGLNAVDSTGIYPNYRGITVIGAYRWLPEMQAVLMSEIELGEALAVSGQITTLSIGITVVVLIAAAALGSFVAIQITRPINILTRTASAVINGDLTQRAHVRSRNEIGQLATAFNQMTDRLNDLINTLEQRVTERTRELEHARQQAEHANQAKSIFLSNMSHELRTPLNMVIGYTSSMLTMPQMYQGQKLPEVFKADVSLIQQNGQHLLGLINDVLDLSKIEAGKFELQCEAVDLTDIFKGVIATSVGLLRGKPIQIQPDYPDNLPTVWADALRVRQILLNLMANAIKFTETGTITLSARVQGNRVSISVTDTGIGIPEESLSIIFDRFQQVKNDASIQGTGLGLDISQRLAQLHGSEITIESTMGKGSKFMFSLGLATPEQMTLPVRATPNILGDATTFASSPDITELPRVVLLVEPDATTRETLHRLLEEAGHAVVDAHAGQQAIELAAGLMPDIVILDDTLKGISSAQVIEKITAQNEAVSIILLTTSGGHPLSLPRLYTLEKARADAELLAFVSRVE